MGRGGVNKQGDIRIFSGMCVALAIGLGVLKSGLDIHALAPSPDNETVRSTAVARLSAPAPGLNETRFIIKGESVGLGDSAVISFTTDERGVGRFPLEVAKPSGKKGSAMPIQFMPSISRNRLKWGAGSVEMDGLRPSSTYKMEAALWLWARPIMSNGSVGEEKAFDHKMSSAQDCESRCVLAMGLPSLVSTQEGPQWKQMAVSALSSVPAPAPLLLIALGLLWRSRLRPWARKALVAVGADKALPMQLGVAKV